MTNRYIEEIFTLDIYFRILYLNHFDSNCLFTHVLHSHAFVELFYITSGEGYVQLGDENRVPMKEGDFLLINPHTEHCEYSTSDPAMSFSVYGVADISFSQNGKAVPYLKLSRSDRESESRHINTLYDNIRAEMTDRKDKWQNMVHAYLEELIIYITRALGVGIDRERYSGGDTIKRAEEFIDTHIGGKIDLDELAKFACVNKCTLINLFKREYGLTPMRYIMHKRIYKAIDLISTTDKSLSMIIGECGFVNSAHFYQAFKRITGGTPSEYKKSK